MGSTADLNWQKKDIRKLEDRLIDIVQLEEQRGDGG